MTDEERKAQIPSVEAVLQKKFVELVFDHDQLYRSHIIYEASAIEGMIEDTVAWCFCPDSERHLAFKAFIFMICQVPFSKKIEILKKVLEKYHPDLLEDIRNLINELNSIRRFRNKFAHNEPMFNDDLVNSMKTGILLKSINRDVAQSKVVEMIMPGIRKAAR